MLTNAYFGRARYFRLLPIIYICMFQFTLNQAVWHTSEFTQVEKVIKTTEWTQCLAQF